MPVRRKTVVAQIEAEGGKAVCQSRLTSGRVSEIVRLFDETIARFATRHSGEQMPRHHAAKPSQRRYGSGVRPDFCRERQGTFFACQQATTRLADGGRIVNMSSSTTARMMPGYGAYVATKGAVETTDALTRRGKLGGVASRSMSFSPGPTETELFTSGKTPQQIEQFARASAFGRLGQPDGNLRRWWLFLASEAGRLGHRPEHPRKCGLRDAPQRNN